MVCALYDDLGYFALGGDFSYPGVDTYYVGALMIIGEGSVIRMMIQRRHCWIGGNLGGGKTSFAVWISQYWLRKGYKFYSTAPCVWNDDPREMCLGTDHKIRAVFLIDEAGLDLMSSRQVTALIQYAAKLELIVWWVGNEEPPMAARKVRLMPLVDLQPALIPVIPYMWKYSTMGYEHSGVVVWLEPAESWGLYDRCAPQVGYNRIMDGMARCVSEYKAKYEADDDKVEIPGVAGARDEDAKESALLDALKENTEALDAVAAISSRRRSGR